MKKVLVFLIALLFVFNSIAQQSSIKFGHIGLKEGLSQSDVLTIQQTKNGL